MNRHRQRDLEAGGLGCGVLDTRKRAWKCPDGSIADKRPRLDHNATASYESSGIEDFTSGQVVSPPISDEGIHSHGYQLERDEGDAGERVNNPERSSISGPHSVVNYLGHSHSDGGISASPTSISKPQPTSKNDPLEYHPAFQPDTASSFNMPYTTALDYNWLFNLDAVSTWDLGLFGSGSTFDEHSALQRQDLAELIQCNDMATNQQTQNFTPKSQSHGSWQSLSEHCVGHTDSAETRPAPTSSSLWKDTVDQTRRAQSSTTKDLPVNVMTAPSTQGNRKGREEAVNRPVVQNGSHDSLAEGQASRQPERPLSMLRDTASLPQVDQSTRERLLCVIETANPQFPDHAPDALIRDHPLLSLSSLQSWLDLFFTHFNTSYPLIHMPTFDPDSTQPLLLLAVILLGATYSDKAAHQVAVCIHDVIRPSIFAHAGFSPSPELWTLQTLLLVECFGKSRSGQKQHDMSHLFHGLLINLIRRSDCQSIGKTASPPENNNDPAAVQEAWKCWADSEQKKRLALLCFMWDTQHAVLFCQSLCMSAFELRCELPHAQVVWEAPDAESWAIAWRSLQPPSSQLNAAGSMFLPMLKAYLAPRPALEVRPTTNAFSLVIVLHGIMSIAWDMQRRDQTSLGVHTTVGAPKWRQVLSEAYNRWKIDFDSYCCDAVAKGDDDTRNEWLSFSAAYKAVYHAAQSLLHMDFLDVQIYAGARHILGKPVRQHDYIRSSKIVKRWAASSRERAATAAWHASNMLAEVVTEENAHQRKSDEADPTCPATNTNLFHVPWCIYLATLTCWAFHHAKASRGNCEIRPRERLGEDEDSAGEDSDFSDEMVWDSHKEMRDLVKDMVGSGHEQDAVRNLLSIQGRKGTNGLAWLVADLLSKVRWGIVHAGVMVLRGLVPMRLINQYETAY